jgi:hypothetical protein
MSFAQGFFFSDFFCSSFAAVMLGRCKVIPLSQSSNRITHTPQLYLNHIHLLMSLLSGIRFVPKEERTNQDSDSDSGSTDSEKHKHHKKKQKHHKSDSKHKKKKKEKDNKRKYSDLKKRSKGKGKDRDSPSEHDNAAEIKFMESLVESEGLEMDPKKSKSNVDFDKYNMYDNNNNRGSMINYSKLAFEETPLSDNEEEVMPGKYRYNDDDDKTNIKSPQLPQSDTHRHGKSDNASFPAAPPAVSNQSMAAILRARLQKGEKLVSAPATDHAASTAPGPSSYQNRGGDNYRNEGSRNNNDRYSNSNNRSGRRNTSQQQQEEKEGVDIASFMSVGELKWMSAYKLKEKEGGISSASSSGVPTLPVRGEKDCSLQYLVAMEKSGGGLTGTAGDIDKIFAENIIKRGSGYRGNELGLGSGMGAQRGSGGDRAGMDEEEGMGVTSWLGTEADVDSDDNNEDNAGGRKGKQKKGTSSSVPSKSMIEKMKKKEKDLVNGVDMTMFQQKEDKLNEKQIYDRIVKKALAKKKTYGQTVSNCPRCVAGRKFRRDLVLSTGSYFQLRLKSRNDSLVPGWHCELVPLAHASSVLLAEKEGEGECVVREGVADSGLFKELERFKCCLQRMFERMGKGVVFTETATRSGASRHHTSVDVLPVDRGAEGEVHMSFKQAFRDSGDAYSTHKRRIIPTNSTSKTFHSCVPSHFPYMLVEWGDVSVVKTEEGGGEMQGNGGQVGLVYILDAAISINDSELDKEDTGDFGTAFCLDVMAGVLEIDQLERRLMRQGGRGAQGGEREDLQRFREEWSVFDWTAYDSCV